MAMAVRVAAWNGPGHRGVRPVSDFAVHQWKLARLPALRSLKLQRHAQPCRLGSRRSFNLVVSETVSLDSRRLGAPHCVRHSAARDRFLSDALSVAAAHSIGRRRALGTTAEHVGELRSADPDLYIPDRIAPSEAEGGAPSTTY